MPRRSTALAAAALLLAAPAPAQQPEDPYQLTPPEGWTRTTENGALVLTPPGPDAEKARIIVLPPEVLEEDFEAQATRKRTEIELALGLADPRPAPAQRTEEASRRRLSWHASYPSPGGDRFAGFFSLAEERTFALVVFYSSTPEAYGRLAPPAQALFLGLSVKRAAVTPPPGRAPPPAPGAAPLPEPAAPRPPAAPSLRERLLGAWSSFRPPGDVANPTWPLLSRAGMGMYWQFRADGTYRHAFRRATSPTNWFGMADEGRWTLEGDQLTVKPESMRNVAELDRPGGRGTFKPLRYRVSFDGSSLVLTDEFGPRTLPRAR